MWGYESQRGPPKGAAHSHIPSAWRKLISTPSLWDPLKRQQLHIHLLARKQIWGWLYLAVWLPPDKPLQWWDDLKIENKKKNSFCSWRIAANSFDIELRGAIWMRMFCFKTAHLAETKLATLKLISNLMHD